MINLETGDIWSLPYVQIMVPICSARGVGPQYERPVVWDTGVRE